MKRIPVIAIITSIAVIVSTNGAEPPSKAPRLIEVSKFSVEYQPAVRAIVTVVTKEGMKPGEYFAEISRRDSSLHFLLIHESHDPDPSWRGDSCSKCRTIDYDLRSGSVSKLFGIR